MKPRLASAAERWRWLRLTHRNAASGSPRIDGSTSSFAAPHRPGPEARQAAAYGAAGNPGGLRSRGNSAAAGSACFTGREQASVSFIEERSKCIVAGPDGVLVDQPGRLEGQT